MKFTILNTLSIVILFQLALLIVFLFTSSKGKKVSNWILGSFFLLLAINIGDGILSIAGFYQRFPIWAHLEDGFILLFGPLLYFYTSSIVYRDFAFKRKHVVHLVPFLIVSVSLLIFYHTQSKTEQQFIESAVVRRELPVAFYFIAILIYIHVIGYLGTSLQKVFMYKEKIKQKFSSVHKLNLNWLIFLLISLTLILLISLINIMAPVTGPREWFDYTLLVVIIVLFLFINVVVFKGLKQPEIFAGIDVNESNDLISPHPSIIVEDESKIIHQRLELLMVEKVFLNPELSLDVLADRVGISPKRLSQIINTTYERNFFDYVNSFRIEEAMRILRDSPDPGLTVLEAMYQSGFNSKSSFNTIFKKKTGLTPTAYRRQYQGG